MPGMAIVWKGSVMVRPVCLNAVEKVSRFSPHRGLRDHRSQVARGFSPRSGSKVGDADAGQSPALRHKKTEPDYSGPVAGMGFASDRSTAEQTFPVKAVFQRNDGQERKECAKADQRVRRNRGTERKQDCGRDDDARDDHSCELEGFHSIMPF